MRVQLRPGLLMQHSRCLVQLVLVVQRKPEIRIFFYKSNGNLIQIVIDIKWLFTNNERLGPSQHHLI